MLKTKRNDASVADFIGQLSEGVREDCNVLLRLMQGVTGLTPEMWGDSIVGFGSYTYKAGNKDAEWFPLGFSPRKANLTIYLTRGLAEHADCLAKLGPHKTGVGCLYVKRLSDIDLGVLKELIARTPI